MSKLRHLIVSLNILSCASAFSSMREYLYYPTDLVKNFRNYSTEIELKQRLRDVLGSHHEKRKGKRDIIHSICPAKKTCYKQRTNISYKEARKYLFGELHLLKDSRGKYFIKDRYCKIKFTKEHGVAPGQIPNHQHLNCEHTWPQSRFNPNYNKKTQKNDIHHLFPVQSRANSSRGKILFGEVYGDTLSDTCKSSSRGEFSDFDSYEKAFQPPEDHRGDVARALFYFSIRYNAPIDHKEEHYLRIWHQEDPVSAFEKTRNQRIFEIQKNRNPFIDQPELVDLISNF